MPTECPECGRAIRGSRCVACGWEVSSQRERSARQVCRWQTSGRRCQQWATVYPWPGGPNAEGVCGWHAVVQSSPSLESNYERFQEFCLDLSNRHYCTLWTHYPTESNWRMVQGLVDDRDRNMRPTPCEQPGCRYATVEVESDLTIQESREKLHMMLRTLVKKPDEGEKP